jgi:hypothetical protein
MQRQQIREEVYSEDEDEERGEGKEEEVMEEELIRCLTPEQIQMLLSQNKQ